jgi:hypothetical protein
MKVRNEWLLSLSDRGTRSSGFSHDKNAVERRPSGFPRAACSVPRMIRLHVYTYLPRCVDEPRMTRLRVYTYLPRCLDQPAGTLILGFQRCRDGPLLARPPALNRET